MRVPRRLFVVAAVACALMGAGAANAATPSLGGSLGPNPYIVETDAPAIYVTNRSSVPVDVALSVSGDQDYRLATSEIRSLAPLARQAVAVTATGLGQAKITALITTDPPPGTVTDAVGLSLTVTARHESDLEHVERVGLTLGQLALALALAAFVLNFLRQRVKNRRRAS